MRARLPELTAFDPQSRVVRDETRREVESARGRGAALHPELRAPFEAQLGIDLSRARVHTDGRADVLSRQLRAEAFTVQNDVFFRNGAFAPGTRGGDELLAHELTHVAQFGGPSRPAGTMRVSSPGDASEREAARHVDGGVASRAAAGAVHRSPEKRSLKVESDRMVQEYVEGFDVALGKWLADHKQSAAGGRFLLLGVHKVLKAQFTASGDTDEGAFLTKAFGPPAELAKMPGAPKVLVIDDLVTVAKSTAAGSLRTKMSLVYMAIRGGVLTAGLHAARTQSEQAASTQPKRDRAVKKQWGVDAAKLRAVDVGGGAKPETRNYFTRQARVEHQQREVLGGVGTGLAAQEARTIGQSEFVGISLSYDEMKTIAKGDTKARAAATKANKVFDTLGEGEKRALMIEEYGDVPLPEYTPGFAIYRVDPQAQEAKEARSHQTRMVGGLSGSTDMYLHLASYLGASNEKLQLVRLAAFGEMLARRDHSFYEVVIAGRGYGLTDIDPALGVDAYASIPPFTKAQIEQGTRMALPSDYAAGVSGKGGQAALREDLRSVQASAKQFAKQVEKAKKAVPPELVERWQDFYRSTGYRWAHDPKVQDATRRVNAVLGATTGVAVALPDAAARGWALQVLQIVQAHSGNPTRVVPEVYASQAFKQLEILVGSIPANQVVAAYVKQYVGPVGLIVPSVQFAAELQAIERGGKPLPPIAEVGDKAAVYANTVWPEAKSELHKRAQAAEDAYATKLAQLDTMSATYGKDKAKLDAQYNRDVATGAVETWKRVEAHIQAAEGLSPTERYAIYTYTQGDFYKELNGALSGGEKLTTKQRAVALAATSGLRKLPVYPGPVFRAQRTGQGLRQKGVSKTRLDAAAAAWKPGKTVWHDDFLSTFKHAKGPREFMETEQGKQYDLVVRIEKVKSGRWTLLLSAAEAIAAGMNPEHEGEVTFPPGSRFRVTKPLNVAPAERAAKRGAAYCETTWEETTPAQAAPPGNALPTIADSQVPATLRGGQGSAATDGAVPQPPSNVPLPPSNVPKPPSNVPKPPPNAPGLALRGPARGKAVALVPANVRPQVAVIVAPPDIADLVGGVTDVKLPDPPQELVDALLGPQADTS
jgi:hypothetical protein